ncbi:serine/threonine-protein kinase M1 [Entomophthora muscae]|uniref:Serine/threonine-protein kinase M1 n=1 Tax=Entomophthora muscae TaxID=34485 RepID=A0ACC2RXI1_9FUNG|nr:serine/threonine-protein kinase M1 [Entomophthora muscae]
MLAKQIQATELLYSELCSIATLFSFSANHLETWSDETKHCYHSIFAMFAAVWKDSIYNITYLDLNTFDKDKLEKLLAASKKKLTLLFKDISLTLDLGVENLLSIVLSGMVALLSNSEIDYDVNFPLLLAIIFYSLHKSSPVSLQAHVWRIMPKALAGTFLSYLKPESILLLINIICQEESICDEVKHAFALNLGKLICSISANCTSADFNHLLPFPSGEVLCAYCDKEFMVLHQGELCSDRANKLVSLLPEPLEDYPMQALRFLLNFILGTDCLQTRIGASLSLCCMLTHLPLKCYTPLLNLIPELVLLIMDDNSKICLIISTALLNLSPFEDSEERQIFLLKLVDQMFNSIKDDPSEFSLNLVLSLVAHPVALSFMLNCLSQYFYHDDKQIAASIFSQLHGIAAAQKIMLKTLFSPLWETLAGFILTDFKNQGHFVTNMAIALQVDQSGILKLACPYLLPMVVIKRDFEMLKKLAGVIKSEIRRSRSEETQVLDLCSDYLPYILAGLFLWDGEDFLVSLNFFFGLFNPNTPLKGKVIIDSCIADLILVLSFEFGRLGDHELSNAKENLSVFQT